MTATQLDEAAINVYAALRHLTLAQVASVSHLTVGEVVQHALAMRFVESANGVSLDTKAPAKRRKSPAKKVPLQEFDEMVFGIVQENGGWVSIGGIQDHPSLDGVNVQRTRRALYRLMDSGRIKAEGEARARVYALAG